MDAQTVLLKPFDSGSKAYDSEPKVLAKAKTTIKYTDGREIILEGYAGEDIATIIKALR